MLEDNDMALEMTGWNMNIIVPHIDAIYWAVPLFADSHSLSIDMFIFM